MPCAIGYATANPPNGQPLLLGIDNYDASNKAATQATAVSRTWPLLVLEAQGNYTVQAIVTCPSAGMNNDAPKDITSSPDGTCGGTLRYKCQDTKFFYGNCCGADGYCGYSPNECATGWLVSKDAPDRHGRTDSQTSQPIQLRPLRHGNHRHKHKVRRCHDHDLGYRHPAHNAANHNARRLQG